MKELGGQPSVKELASSFISRKYSVLATYQGRSETYVTFSEGVRRFHFNTFNLTWGDYEEVGFVVTVKPVHRRLPLPNKVKFGYCEIAHYGIPLNAFHSRFAHAPM
jgi:hypothetical protein